jgi:hypothetical protein
MPLCDICEEDVTSPARHKSERHSTPPPIEIFGVLAEFHRDADDGNRQLLSWIPTTVQYYASLEA